MTTRRKNKSCSFIKKVIVRYFPFRLNISDHEKGDMESRRKALFYLMSLPFGYLFFQRSKQLIQWKGNIHLPRQMEWDVFEIEVLSKYMNLKEILSIREQMIRTGDILISYTQFFNNKKICWTYVFNSNDSFQKWNKLTGKLVSEEFYSLYKGDTNIKQVSHITKPHEHVMNVISYQG